MLEKVPKLQFRQGNATVAEDYELDIPSHCIGDNSDTLYRIRIPASFVCDGASVPWLFRRLFPKYCRNTNAAVVHDWLYASQIFPRKVADKMFRYVQSLDGVPRWKRSVMYRTLRAFGSFAWRKCTKLLKRKVQK